MAVFPVQNELIDSVIDFANAEIADVSDAGACFVGMWEPRSLPRLEQCKSIQREVRRWLLKPSNIDYINAYMFSDGKGFTSPRIEFLGLPGYRVAVEGRKKVSEITWQWWVYKGSLRAICGFAVANLHSAGLADRVGRCVRERHNDIPACRRFFVDNKSRGQPREYCLSDYCNAVRNRQRIKASRSR